MLHEIFNHRNWIFSAQYQTFDLKHIWSQIKVSKVNIWKFSFQCAYNVWIWKLHKMYKQKSIYVNRILFNLMIFFLHHFGRWFIQTVNDVHISTSPVKKIDSIFRCIRRVYHQTEQVVARIDGIFPKLKHNDRDKNCGRSHGYRCVSSQPIGNLDLIMSFNFVDWTSTNIMIKLVILFIEWMKILLQIISIQSYQKWLFPFNCHSLKIQKLFEESLDKYQTNGIE